ncbi:DNA integrity scanning diadenylate cyclase DisA [Actinomadura madurae]|uniref:DNA integrity scanning diadenylate cyclase DisA n=1 Tax=Actinomadura madurae TaxID=1993 RepID=UPI0020D1FB4C|nr:DNA integrity scanning diadenylate cyclase DisA [Actinomadura madurae]MCP9969555.1 DNA integrity scanning diadenylate cyclase DisA [Actinomadura madurae]
MAPGTQIRDGLERILRGHTGGLIVLGYDKTVEELCSGGFELDVQFSATRLRELAKMDGAIVLDDSHSRIVRAAVHLVPDSTIPTEESGTRHRTAERVARQTVYPVISVSQSMHIIALYLDGIRYVLEDSAAILSKANQALATLERYKLRLDEVSGTLSALEIEDLVTVRDVSAVVQRLEMVRRIADEIEGYVVELGTDGRLLSLQLDELVSGVDADRELIVRDYPSDDTRARGVDAILSALDTLSATELLDLSTVAEVMGFAGPRRPRPARQPEGLPPSREGAAPAEHGRRAPRRALRRPAETPRRQHRRSPGGRRRGRVPRPQRPRGPVPPGRIVDPGTLCIVLLFLLLRAWRPSIVDKSGRSLASLRLALRLAARSGSRFARPCLRTRSQPSRFSRGCGSG